jgi:putative copper export protein
MTDRQQQQNDILVRCIHQDSSGELHRGEEQITQAERQERCLRRAVWLMALVTALAAAGLGYSFILLYELPPYQTRIINHLLTVVGLAALISFLAFGAFWILCRHRLAARREEVRRLVMKLLAERSGHRSAADNS